LVQSPFWIEVVENFQFFFLMFPSHYCAKPHAKNLYKFRPNKKVFFSLTNLAIGPSGIGLTGNGPSGNWTNWYLEQMAVGPTGNRLNGNGQTANWTNWRLDKVVIGQTDNAQNGHWTTWLSDQVVIGLTSNGQSSNWTKWSLDQLKKLDQPAMDQMGLDQVAINR
jgi:hypothetical protein